MELLLLLPFANNLVLSGVKFLADSGLDASNRNWVLRGALILFSLAGVIATSFLNGAPVDANQVTELVKMLLETILVAFASHWSYKAIKNA